MQALHSAGVKSQVTLSLQSFDPKTLEAVKRSNIHQDTFLSLKSEYNKRNIPTYTELILGLPGETYDSFCSGLIKAVSPFPKDHFNIYLCRLLENAEMASPGYKEKWGIKTRSCEVAMARRYQDNFTVLEEEIIVVETATMNSRDWSKSFSFGYLVSTLYNLRLANVMINYLNYNLGYSPRDYIDFLILNISPEHKVLKSICDNFLRFQVSILNNEKSVLTLERFGNRYWEPHESAFLLANLNTFDFYKELQSLTQKFLAEKDASVMNLKKIDELFKFQSLYSPLHRNHRKVIETFEFDWLHYVQNMQCESANYLIEKKTKLEFQPVSTYQENLEAFAISQLSASNSESGPTSQVVAIT